MFSRKESRRVARPDSQDGVYEKSSDPERQPKATSENIEALIASNTNSTLPAGKLDSHDGDEALKAFLNREGPPLVIDEATNKRLLRRIDLHLMPVRYSKVASR